LALVHGVPTGVSVKSACLNPLTVKSGDTCWSLQQLCAFDFMTCNGDYAIKYCCDGCSTELLPDWLCTFGTSSSSCANPFTVQAGDTCNYYTKTCGYQELICDQNVAENPFCGDGQSVNFWAGSTCTGFSSAPPPPSPPSPPQDPAPDGCEMKSGSMWCDNSAVAKAFVAASGDASDCVNAMAIALGEGVNPECKTNPSPGKRFNLECLASTNAYNMDQRPYDGLKTLGPWQVTTDVLSGASLDDRVSEAIKYVQDNCNDLAHCPTERDGECDSVWGAPITTIFSVSIGPFCGCPATGTATMGYSGRCSNKDTDDYTRNVALATRLCQDAGLS